MADEIIEQEEIKQEEQLVETEDSETQEAPEQQEEEITENQELVETVVEPLVYQKQPNEQGIYVDKDGIRYEILTCHHTESKEQVQVGTKIEIIDGQEVEVPIYEMQVVINKGWDNFDSLEQAMEAYGLTDTRPDESLETKEDEVVIFNKENTTEEQGEAEK